MPCKSYFSRYLKGYYKRRYRRTAAIGYRLASKHQEEEPLFLRLKKDIRFYVRKERFKKPRGFISSYKPLNKRVFSLGRIYITYRRRNTFITIYQVSFNNKNEDQRVVFKATAGVVGYKGPKKRTRHARECVAKAAGSFLANNQFTSIDILLTSGIGRVYTFFIRNLFQDTIYVRHIYITRRRSHGYTRLKKAKRR